MFKLPAETAALFNEIEAQQSFEPFLDLLSGDVEFSATIGSGTPISGSFKGKQEVERYFREILPTVASFEQLQPQEFVIAPDRAIILGDDQYTIVKNGKAYHSPYAMVLDIKEGLIKKVLIIQDLSGIRDAYL